MSNLPPFVKYPHIDRLGHDSNHGLLVDPTALIVVQEKIDGGNGQIRLDGEGRLLFGTRNHHFRLEPGQPQQFSANAEWVAMHVTSPLNPDYVYFGEWCKKHTINYDWRTMPLFLGFDVYNVASGRFLPWLAVVEEYGRVGLPVVEVLTQSAAKDVTPEFLEFLIGKSRYYDGPMEGMVLKNYYTVGVYGQPLFAKLVTRAFKEANMAAFGGVRTVNDDTARFMDAFYTPARIRKVIFRLMDEDGFKLSREMMHFLPQTVAEDIFAEEAWAIIRQFKQIRFDLLKKSAPKLCLAVLDDMILGLAFPESNSKEMRNAESGV